MPSTRSLHSRNHATLAKYTYPSFQAVLSGPNPRYIFRKHYPTFFEPDPSPSPRASKGRTATSGSTAANNTRQESAPNDSNTIGSEDSDDALVPAIAADTASEYNQTSADAESKEACPDADPQTTQLEGPESSMDPSIS